MLNLTEILQKVKFDVFVGYSEQFDVFVGYSKQCISTNQLVSLYKTNN